MVIIRLMLLGLIPVCLADGLDDLFEGDSGGPLAYYERTKEKFFSSVVDITSLDQCDSPATYTRVSEHVVSIQKVIFDGGLHEEFEDKASNYLSDTNTNSGGPIVFIDDDKASHYPPDKNTNSGGPIVFIDDDKASHYPPDKNTNSGGPIVFIDDDKSPHYPPDKNTNSGGPIVFIDDDKASHYPLDKNTNSGGPIVFIDDDKASDYPPDKNTNSGGPIVFKDDDKASHYPPDKNTNFGGPIVFIDDDKTSHYPPDKNTNSGGPIVFIDDDKASHYPLDKNTNSGGPIVFIDDDKASYYPPDKNTNSGGSIVVKDNGNFQRTSELKCEQYITKTIFFNQDTRRIFNGKPAQKSQFPFIGAVGWEAGNDTAKPYEFKCGSTLISEKFVLTAGHCTSMMIDVNSTRVEVKPRVVLLGVENLDLIKVALSCLSGDGHGRLVQILKITHHPEYDFVARYDDIAVMELAKEVEFTQHLYPACLWSRGDVDLVDKRATIAGWGATYSKATQVEDHLQYGEVTIIDQSICNITLQLLVNRHWEHGVDDKQMCAMNMKEKTDTCKGDSGGPLVYYTLPKGYSVKEFPSVVGVTSFGDSCGYAPGMYVRVSSYIDWIEKMVWPNETLDWRTPNGV